MDVTIRSRNTEVPDNLRATVEEKVSRLSRFLDGMDHAEVLFSEERNPRISEKDVCEVTMTGHGHLVRAKAAASDPFAAVDRVVDKLEHQIEKLKGKLLGRSHPRRHGPVDSVKTGQSTVAVGASGTDTEGDQLDDGEMRIVKTKRFEIKPMTPEEAVLQMELLGHSFFVFRDAGTSEINVLYRREDGNYGLIVPGEMEE